MNKKERKASKALAEAQAMVAKICAKKTAQAKPKVTPLPIHHQDYKHCDKVLEACIMKVKKGEWQVLYKVEGDNEMRNKKCKSETQAKEWVAKHKK